MKTITNCAKKPRDAVEHAHFKERVMMELHAPKNPKCDMCFYHNKDTGNVNEY